MDGLNADLALHIIQYLHVGDSSRLAVTSKRLYYLVHQYRKLRGPEIVTVASWNHGETKQNSREEMVQQATERMQSSPDFVLAFQNPRSALSDVLTQKQLPKDTVVLGVMAGSIQVNLPGNDNVLEHQSSASAMYASFPNAVVQPYHVDSMQDIQCLKSRLHENNNTEWKAMIVYACGNGAGFAETFLAEMQSTLPNVVFVGGICHRGYVSATRFTKEQLSKMSIRKLQQVKRTLLGASGDNVNFLEKSELVDHIFKVSSSKADLVHLDDAVFGVALGGDVPIRSMVSRGVRSLTHGIPQPTSPYIVHESKLTKPDDEEYFFRGHDLKPIHMIKQIRNVEDGKIYTACELMVSKSNSADFVGLKKPSRDGFELNMLSPYCHRAESYLIMTDGSSEQEESLEGAEIDFFVLDGESCLQDMEATVSKLKEQTMGEEIMGAIMFSCSGRGPGRGPLIRESMADASRFASKFPDVPCLGFYAGGEIGPLALAGKENVFQTGRATLQGFTAVFALFVVPVVEPPKYHLDDCADNVNNYFSERTA